MKAFVFLSLALSLSLLSCQKEETKLPCEANNFGSYCFENITSAPINIYVDGNFKFTLAGGAEECIPQLSVGLHQVLGYQPSTGKEWAGSLDVIQCTLKNSVFRP